MPEVMNLLLSHPNKFSSMVGGGWMILYIFDCSSPFYFLFSEFRYNFFRSYNIIPYYGY